MWEWPSIICHGNYLAFNHSPWKSETQHCERKQTSLPCNLRPGTSNQLEAHTNFITRHNFKFETHQLTAGLESQNSIRQCPERESSGAEPRHLQSRTRTPNNIIKVLQASGCVTNARFHLTAEVNGVLLRTLTKPETQSFQLQKMNAPSPGIPNPYHALSDEDYDTRLHGIKVQNQNQNISRQPFH